MEDGAGAGVLPQPRLWGSVTFGPPFLPWAMGQQPVLCLLPQGLMGPRTVFMSCSPSSLPRGWAVKEAFATMKLKGSPLWDAWPPVPSFVPASGNSGRGCGYWEGLWVLRDRCPGSELVPMWTRRSPPEALAVAQGKTSQPGCLLDREGGGRGGQGRETSDPFIPSPCQPAGLSLGDAEHGDSLPRPSRPAA